MQKIRAQGRRFINGQGDEVLLSGINLVCKEKDRGYLFDMDDAGFARLAAQGVNVLRFGLIWDGVEPEPGVYDDAYLARARAQVEMAARHGIYAFLDMHQDLYSVRFGDGAPEWATLDGGHAHVTGDHWADAYFTSPAVIASLDAFWRGAPDARGVGLLDRYAAMWAHVARAFAGCGGLIGYDLLNEPYPGALGGQVMRHMAETYLRLSGQGNGASDALLEHMTREDSKQDLLAILSDMDIYRPIAGAASALLADFEQSMLRPLYAKVMHAIREAGGEGMLLCEPTMFANAAIAPSDVRPEGEACAYAPHGYDLTVDTDHFESYSPERVRLIFEIHARTQARWDVPVLVGEWGAFNHNPVTQGLTRDILRIFEQNLWSHTYWCWYEGFDASPAARALRRAYPAVTAGELLDYAYDHDTGAFSLRYQARQGGVTRVYYPDGARLPALRADTTGPVDSIDVEHGDGGHAFLVVRAYEDGEATLTLTPV